MPDHDRRDCDGLAALELAYPGIAERPAGLMLWPAIASRAVVALLLTRSLRSERRAEVDVST